MTVSLICHFIIAFGCGIPSFIRFAEIVWGDGVSQVAYECFHGYQFKDKSYVKHSICLESGVWSLLDETQCEGTYFDSDIFYHVKVCVCVLYIAEQCEYVS